MYSELDNVIKNYFNLFEVKPINQIKIDHYSWSDNSVYRYFEKELINKHLIRQVEIAIENEFIRWDDEYSKQMIIEGLGLMRCDKNIPSCDAWEDVHTFESVAIKSLKAFIKNNKDLDIIGVVHKAESQLIGANIQGNIQKVQICERILYELNESSLREFAELKKATLDGDN